MSFFGSDWLPSSNEYKVSEGFAISGAMREDIKREKKIKSIEDMPIGGIALDDIPKANG